MSRLVYIAGPFAGDTAENTRRAVAISRYATIQGLSPICVHPGILAGAYGDDAVPEERERGLAAVVSIVREVAKAGGTLWVLLRDDRSMSAGTRREWDAFADAGGRAVVSWTWSHWCESMRAAGVAVSP